MRSLFKNLFNSPMRSPTATAATATAEESYAFKLHLTPGALPYDEVTSVPASCSISGVRYGLVNGVFSSFDSNVPPVEDKGLRGCPAFTPWVRMTETLTAVNWIKGNGSSVVIDGLYNGVNTWFWREGTSALIKYLEQLSVFNSADNNTYNNISCIVKRKDRNLRLHLLRKDRVEAFAYFNLSTGSVHSTTGGILANITALGGGYYRCWASVNVLSGESLYYVSGGNFALVDDSYSETYTGQGDTYGIYIGQPMMYNSGAVPSMRPYIPNDTTSFVSVVSETATATTGTSFDLDLSTLSRLKTGLRGPHAQGHIELEFESNVDSGWYTSATALSLNILSCNDQPYTLRFRWASGLVTIRMEDSSQVNESVSTSMAMTVGQTFKIALDYGTYTNGTQKMRLTVNGVKSSVVAFSGSFGAQDLRFFYDNTVHAGWIKNLSYSEKPLW